MSVNDVVQARGNVAPLFSDQLYFLENITPRCRALFLRYGAGKSRIALEYVFLSRPNPPTRSLQCIIFCKARNVATWYAEINKWFPAAHIASRDEGVLTLVEELSKIGKEVLLLKVPDFLIIPHNRIFALQAPLSKLIQYYDPDLIMDESTGIKNNKAQVTQAACELRSFLLPQCKTLVLSGNPIPENPMEIFTQFEFAYGENNPFGNSYYQFLRNWCIKTNYGYTLRLERIDEYKKVVMDYSLGYKPEHQEKWAYRLEGKRVQYAIEYYTPSRQQVNLLEHLWEHWELPETGPITEEKDEVTRRAQHSTEEFSYSISMLQKAQQIAGGFYYDARNSPVYLRTSPKIDLLIEVLQTLLAENPARQIIVWQDYIAEREPILLALSEAQISAVLGPDDEALKLFEFGAGPLQLKPSVVVMPARTSHGLNSLKNADTAIFFSSPYSQELRAQAEERNTALRQQYPVVNIIDLAAPGMADLEVVVAQQAKSFTPDRARTIVNKYSTRKKESK